MDLLQGYTSNPESSPPRKRKAVNVPLNVELPRALASAYKPKRRAMARFSESQKPELEIEELFGAKEIPSTPSQGYWQSNGKVNRIRWNTKFPTLLATASMQPGVQIWSAFEKKLMRTLEHHTDAIKDIQWSVDGRNLFSCSFDQTIACVDAERNQCVTKYQGNHRFTALATHKGENDLILAGNERGEVVCWDTRSGAIAQTYQKTCGEVHSIAFMPSQTQFITSSTVTKTSSADKGVAVWDFETGALMSKSIYREGFTCSSIEVGSIVQTLMHPIKPYFALQSHGNYIATVSTSKLKLHKKKYFGHTSEGYGLDCSFNTTGDLIASGDASGRVVVYNTKTHSSVFSCPVHDGVCMCVAFHPTLPFAVASGGWNSCVGCTLFWIWVKSTFNSFKKWQWNIPLCQAQ
ncbi:hypothetical protein THRCLA_20174 [Thraustotheca clavata]|uniref:Uncharacterized protein n=1 Tax=Thraustotheca clavata TaxID=74557 RepID=A0A1W0AAX5_9STRA|nr:hypothetical protein THRCLA_20174 [Thraustotheca clavata]